MSLDDIIKKERGTRNASNQGVKRRFAKKGVGMRRNIRGGRLVSRTGTQQNISGPSGINQRAGAGVNKAATMRMVNKLVKKAISRSANQRLIRRAAMSRRGPLNSGIGAAGFRARRRMALRSRVTGRLRGISQGSRVIIGVASRRARMLRQNRPVVISAPVRAVRGRGTARLGRLVSDTDQVVVQRESVPVIREQMVRAVPRVQQARRQVIVERRPVVVQRRPVVVRRPRGGRPIVLQRTALTQPARRGITRRVVVQQQPRFVVVNNSARRQQPTQPVYERVERVVNVQPRTRFVTVGRGGGRKFGGRQDVIQMREALGIGRPDRERFEPSSSFLQRVPASNRKGRGFREQVYY